MPITVSSTICLPPFEQEVRAKYNMTLSDELAIQAKRFFVRVLYDVTNFILRDALCTLKFDR